MTDRIFRPAIKELEPLFDLYVSSQTCGYRKPNKKGLEYVAEYFGIDASEILFVGDEKKDEDTAANEGCEFKYIADFLKEWN
jgi:putative hydrolase of the HAD superfamily